ncbi:MBL fold metallo-hydrolase [Sphingomonas sp. NSE70-1]|uniref:MBL fold metallo-hydrolase n=1 Tax=Sphingomonas caseinilyticus TaxID=2908205 RepID=A0ABT0RT78_9SPHN|nr:MBL fold metallo-hydrolase [Sphingomonas caseinilyticus]MCL6698114.1 MBL fold metallo-hydrolase [Sphingomonas caseinilyticus]
MHLLLPLLLLEAAAQPATGRTPEEIACDNPADSDGRPFNLCVEETRFNRIQAELDAQLKLTLASVEERKGSAVAEALRNSQQAWVNRRESECQAFAATMPVTQSGRSYASCQARMTEVRIAELKLAAQPVSASPLPFTLKEIGPGVYAAIDGPERKALSNAGFVIGDDGVLVIDSLFTPEAAQALVAEIRRITPKPIKYAVNTHYHADHTGGDQVLRDAGAIIIAHKNVRGWVRTNNINLFGDRLTWELKARVESLPLPDVTTDKDLTIWLGSRKAVVSTVLGHTGGDLVVSVPDAKVLFTGDMLWRKVAPNLIDGSVEEWSATAADFVSGADAPQTRYVPGHGDVADAKDVEEFRAYLLELRRLVGEGQKAALKDDALVQHVAPKMRARFADWAISDRSIAAEVRYMNDELAGTKKRPVPEPD